MVFRSALLGMVLSSLSALAKAQHGGVAVAVEDERAGTPLVKPEPRFRIDSDPRQIFQKLISPAEAERKAAARSLRWETAETPVPFDARLLLVNLDSDDEQEVIFILSASPAATVALVLDHQREGWWQVGKFDYWWHWDSDQAERLIELRETVRS
ncbi:MAG: hypothetical protein U0Q16_07505 [Bryobacteraceae bacterium]